MINKLNTKSAVYALTIIMCSNNNTMSMELSTIQKINNIPTAILELPEKVSDHIFLHMTKKIDTHFEILLPGYINKKEILLSKNNMRLVCKAFVNKINTPTVLYNYYNTNRYTSFGCAFYDLIKRNKAKNIQWILNNRHIPYSLACMGKNNSLIYLPHLVIAKNNQQIAQQNNQNTTQHELMITLLKDYGPTYSYPNVSYNLCLASCIGNIETFKEAYSKHATNNTTDDTILLVICAALKNYDLPFLYHLLQYPEYKTYIENNVSRLTSYLDSQQTAKNHSEDVQNIKKYYINNVGKK